MRFLILSQYYFPEIGAPQVRLRAMVRTLIELGHEVEILTALPNYPQGNIFPNYRGYYYYQEKIDGVDIHRVWLHAATGAGVRRYCNYLSFAFFSLLGLKHCRPADFVFVESPPLLLSIPGVIISRQWQAKMIFNISDLWPDSARELGLVTNKTLLKLAEALERWSYKKAYRITAVTHGIKQNLINKGIQADKILFLPNGVDTSLFKPNHPDHELRSMLRIGENQKIILYAGILGFPQGLDIIIAAAEILLARSEITFVLIGAGSEKVRLQEAAQSRSLKNILFLEPAPSEYIARLYSLSLAGLATLRDIPLFQGASPSKVFPAMASGVPILYCGDGEGAQLVKRAEAGIVLPPENPEALAEGVLQLVDNPKLARKLGLNGRYFSENNLQWSKLVNSWIGQLDDGIYGATK